ncbi:hypothetical protein ONZ45_g11344 [Pleurotus djamor]|nr:hypothetical protein ONZ45_g11344 [Pleurotus djamor]
MECIAIDLGSSSYAATFTADDFEDGLIHVTPPVVMSISDELFETSGKLSCSARVALSNVHEYYTANKNRPSVILTNYRELAVFQPQSPDRPAPTYERISTDKPALALQVVSTAYLHASLPPFDFISLPEPDHDLGVDEDLILPQGPPQDPNAPLLSDETVFATHHRHSDFDRATLVRDKQRALQFFRWREFVQKQNRRVTGRPGDQITARTNEVGLVVPSNRPIFSFDHSEVPSETASHLSAILRDSPLASAGLQESFNTSQSFSLQILSIIAGGSSRSFCTVYKCQLTSIDGEKVISPDLCLKLFDDRFQNLRSPDPEDEDLDEQLPRHFDALYPAELYALNEAVAYDKLQPVQGSLIPWFFGIHQFTFPDGTVLYGLLMEFVEAYNLNSDYVKSLSTSRQIKVIESARHAARLLDIADVSQRDWHHNQILVSKNPETNEDHAVFIDFASTTQTWIPDDRNYLSNYFSTLMVLLGSIGKVSLEKKLVFHHFGDPDDWDSVSGIINVGSGEGKEVRIVTAKDMFSYIVPM